MTGAARDPAMDQRQERNTKQARRREQGLGSTKEWSESVCDRDTALPHLFVSVCVCEEGVMGWESL